MDMRFKNTSRPAGRRGDYKYFEWEVFLDEPQQVLDKVEAVEYRLHRTFPDPIRTVTDRASRFSLKAAGWGEFVIYITVYMQDGSEVDTEHHLELG